MGKRIIGLKVEECVENRCVLSVTKCRVSFNKLQELLVRNGLNSQQTLDAGGDNDDVSCATRDDDFEGWLRLEYCSETLRQKHGLSCLSPVDGKLKVVYCTA